LTVPIAIGAREDLLVDLAAALAPGEPTRLLVIFRIEGFNEFIGHYGFGATDALVDQVAGCLPQASGPLSFYYRPREDELCALVAGRLDGIEGALFEAANAVYDMFGLSGVSLDFGTVVLPHEAGDPVAALALADGRMTGVEAGTTRSDMPQAV
jgi:GGDEF domain-containing protein